LTVPSHTISPHPDSVQPALDALLGTTDQVFSLGQAAPERGNAVDGICRAITKRCVVPGDPAKPKATL